MSSAAWREIEELLGTEAIEEERRTGAAIRISDAVQTALADARRFAEDDPQSATWLGDLDTDPAALPHDTWSTT